MAKSSGFEFSGFASLPVEREFFPQDGMKPGEGVKLSLNLDLLSIERMDQFETEFAEMFEEAIQPIRDMVDEVLDAGDADAKPAKIERQSKIELFAIERSRLMFMIRALVGKEGSTDKTDRFIHSWSVVKDGKPVPLTFDVFRQMPPHGIKRLYRFCLGEANNPTDQEKKVSADT